MILEYSEEIPTLLLINAVVLRINIKNGPYELEFLVKKYFRKSFLDIIDTIDYDGLLINFSYYCKKLSISELVEYTKCFKCDYIILLGASE